MDGPPVDWPRRRRRSGSAATAYRYHAYSVHVSPAVLLRSSNNAAVGCEPSLRHVSSRRWTCSARGVFRHLAQAGRNTKHLKDPFPSSPCAPEDPQGARPASPRASFRCGAPVAAQWRLAGSGGAPLNNTAGSTQGRRRRRSGCRIVAVQREAAAHATLDEKRSVTTTQARLRADAGWHGAVIYSFFRAYPVVAGSITAACAGSVRRSGTALARLALGRRLDQPPCPLGTNASPHAASPDRHNVWQGSKQTEPWPSIRWPRARPCPGTA